LLNYHIKVIAIILLLMPNLASAEIFSWHKVTVPTDNNPAVYGSYSAGCMDGGIKIPHSGVGYILGDVQDNREFGQPEMVNYINALGEKIYTDIGRTLIIGDIANARGGPAPIGSTLHQSHQTGLDVDIWFSNSLTTKGTTKVKQATMLNDKKDGVNKHWGQDKVEILKYAASFNEVDRIFVHPIIKRELCRTNYSKKWMQKIRPWYGHAAHFHIRLKCPKHDKACIPQAPLPEGDGCGQDLIWWFSDDATSSSAKQERKYPTLPDECARVFNQ
jgi:penicillin-insensitive murein DD-endopeptidase